MRAVVRSALIADATLNGLGVAADGTNTFSGDIDSVVVRPFLQMRWGDGEPGVGIPGNSHDKRYLTVWVHDKAVEHMGDYSRIDAIAARMKVVLYNILGAHDTVSGGYVSVIEWQGDSDDLVDDGHDTICRNVTFAVYGSGM